MEAAFLPDNAGQCIETLLGFNMLIADTNLPTVPRGSIQSIIERDALRILGIKEADTNAQEKETGKIRRQKSRKSKKKE